MKFLLDTHIWLWTALESKKLDRRVKARIGSPGSENWISPVSAFEIIGLDRRGKLKLEGGGASWVKTTIQRMGLRVAPVTLEVALVADTVYLEYGDPMDRLLAATAKTFELTLVTADKALLACRQISTLPND